MMSDENYELPDGWLYASLGLITDITSGYGFPKSLQGAIHYKIPFIKVGDMAKYTQSDGSLEHADNWISEDNIRKIKGKTIKRGTLVFPKVGETIRLNRRAIITKDEVIVDNNVMSVKPMIGLFDKFLYLWSKSIDLYPFAVSTTVPSLRKSVISEIQFPLPPLNEQKRIVAKIEEKQAQTSIIRDSLDRLIPMIERYRQSVLAAAFRGDLTKEWRKQNPDVEPASKLLERIRVERKAKWIEAEAEKSRARAEASAKKKGKAWSKDDDKKALEVGKAKAAKKYKVPESVDADGLPELPDGWCWSKIENISFVGTGGTPKRGLSKYWQNGTIPWVSSTVVNQDIVKEASEFVTTTALKETNITLFPKGSIVIAMYGEGKTRGKSSILGIETTTNQALAGIVLERSFGEQGTSFTQKFLDFNYEKTRLSASGGVQPNLNLSIVRNIHLPVPSMQERKQIIKKIEHRFQLITILENHIKSLRTKVDRLDQAILAKAFRGELVPQDPNDEPAAELLKRIQEERELAKPKKKAKRVSKKAKTQKKTIKTDGNGQTLLDFSSKD